MKKNIKFLLTFILLLILPTIIKSNIVIDTPGQYYLTRLHDDYILFGMIEDEMRVLYNLSAVSNPGGGILLADVSDRLTISASDVSLQLGNHRLTGGIDITGSRVSISNGYIDGSNNVSSGISALPGAQDISIRNVTVYGATTGINFEGVNTGLIDNCDFIQNTTGLFLHYSSNIAVNDSHSVANLNTGFELLSSATCCFTNCKALSTGEGNAQTTDQIIGGFISTHGNGNIFEHCIANQTKSIVTDSNSLVAGFALRGSEGCSKIIASEAANTGVNSAGDAIPYGIILQEVSGSSPARNTIIQNTIYCNVTTQTGVGIYGNNVANLIIQNTVYNNPINLQVGSALDEIISQIDEPTLLQNIAIPADTPIPFPANNVLTTQQIKYKLCYELSTEFDNFNSIIDTLTGGGLSSSACASTAIGAPTTINASGIYCLSNMINGAIGVSASNVYLDLNNYRVTQGITVAVGLDQIKIENGVVENSASSDVIKVNSGCSNITLEGVIIKNGLRGISFENVSGSFIKNCDMIGNTTGLELDTSNNIIIDSCNAIRNKNAGFCLLQSTTNCVRDCNALSTGEGNNNILNQTIFGFVSSNGNANIFERCIANATQALSTTDSQSLVAGFALRGSEGCSKIIECESANATTSSNGATIPYGILLQATINDPIITVTSIAPGGDTTVAVYSVSWSPDGKYLAVGINSGSGDSTPDLYLYEFDRASQTLTQLGNGYSFAGTLVTVYSVSWSPDGMYLAVAMFSGSDSNPDLYLFEFNRANQTLTQLGSGYSFAGTLVLAYSVSWSPDGTYLAVGIGSTDSNPDLYLFEFDRANQTLTQLGSGYTPGGDPTVSVFSVSWSPDGTYLAVGISSADTNPDLYLYEFDKISQTLTQLGSGYTPGGVTTATVNSVSWSPDGKYLAVGISSGDTNPDLYLYEFDKISQTLTQLGSGYTPGGDTTVTVYSVSWSPDGTYLAVGINSGSDTDPDLYLYEFDRASQTLTQLGSGYSFAGITNLAVRSVSWSPDGMYLAVGINSGDTNLDLYLYEVLTFPSKNVIKNNTIYCNSGGSMPSGIGISGSSIANLIVGNIAYSNPIMPPVIGTNYAFVTNVFNQLFGDAPTALQNISVDCNEVLLTPPNNESLADQLLINVQALAGCASTPITSADISGGTVSITESGNYCVATDLTADFLINADCVTVNLNGRCITGTVVISSDKVKLQNGFIKPPADTIDLFAVEIQGVNVDVDRVNIACVPASSGDGLHGIGITAFSATANIQITNCMIQAGDAAAGNNNGGDGIIILDEVPMLIENCVIMSGNGGNAATAGDGGDGINVNAGLQVTIRNCIIFSTGVGGSGATANGNGGNGIFINSGSTVNDVQVTGCTIRNTGAAGSGAGTAGVAGKAVDDNKAAGAGESQVFGNFAHNIANTIRFDLQASGVESGVVSPNPPTSTVINPLANVYT